MRVESQQVEGIMNQIAQYKTLRANVQDPNVPTAVSTQPMPDDLRRWVNAIAAAFPGGDVALSRMVTNSVIKRGDTLRVSNVSLDRENVRWIRDQYPLALENLQAWEFTNSMVLLHLGTALLHIDQHVCCSTQSVRDAEATTPMQLSEGRYSRSHHVPEQLRAADAAVHFQAFTVHYSALKATRAQIRERQEELREAFSKRKPPFLHPATWLTQRDLRDGIHWERVTSMQDLVHGTIIQMPRAGGARADGDNALTRNIDRFKEPEA